MCWYVVNNTNKNNFQLIAYCAYQTDEMRDIAIKKNPLAMHYIKKK